MVPFLLRNIAATILALASLTFGAAPAWAWGNAGHRIIGLMALAEIQDPAVRAKIADLLSGPALPDHPQEFTEIGHDIGQRATFADAYRDSDRDGAQLRYKATRAWHFADMDVAAPNFAANFSRACPAQKPLKIAASAGPANACLISKIDQFLAELRAAKTPRNERILALEFLLHFVGDLHQPLHNATKDDDRGGNLRWIALPGEDDKWKLHSYFDGRTVRALGSDIPAVVSKLSSEITVDERAQWRKGTIKDWAIEAHGLAKTVAYNLPATPSGTFTPPDSQEKVTFTAVSSDYVAAANAATRLQVKRAAVRLAVLLSNALAH